VQLGLPSQYPILGLVDRNRRGRIHARPPEQLFVLRSCCPPSPCGRLSRPPTTTRTPPRPTRISRHRALPNRHQQPGTRGAFPTFTMIRLTGSTAGSTPTAFPAGTRSIPPATAPGSNIRAWSEPPSNEAASSLRSTHVRQVSGRLRNQGASSTSLLSLCLSVSLARTRASGSAARPSRCRGASPCGARSRAQMAPSFSGPLHQPRTDIQVGTDEMLFVLHLLSHGASWRTEGCLGFDIDGVFRPQAVRGGQTTWATRSRLRRWRSDGQGLGAPEQKRSAWSASGGDARHLLGQTV
jgi:hypothetical protein